MTGSTLAVVGLVVATSALAKPNDTDPLKLAFAPSTAKVFQDGEVRGCPEGDPCVRSQWGLDGVPGQTEAVQVAVTNSLPSPLTVVMVVELPTPGIVATLQEVGYVWCSNATTVYAAPGGWYPDPLSPPSSPGAPLSLRVPARSTRAVWISVAVPRGASPGQLAGHVQANSAAGNVALELSMRVWSLEVPRRSFGGAWSWDLDAMAPYYGQGAGPLQQPMRDQWMSFACAHGLTPDSLAANNGSRPMSDFAFMGSPPCSSPTYNVMYLGSSSNATPAYVAGQVTALRPHYQVLADNNLTAPAYVYSFDESPATSESAVRALHTALGVAFPSLRTVSVLNWPIPADLPLDIWVVQYELLGRPDITAAARSWLAKSQARRLWGYHCISPRTLPFLNSFIDLSPALQPRLLVGWLPSATTLVSGWLYWRVDQSSLKTSRNNKLMQFDSSGRTTWNVSIWNRAVGKSTNGDGSLVYPGVGGPLASQRLQNLRKGLEDGDLFSMLPATDAARIARQAVSNATQHITDPFLLEQLRVRLLHAITHNNTGTRIAHAPAFF
eukprot:gene4941-122_t